MPDTKQNNLAMALATVEYVQGIMTIGANNKFTDIVQRFLTPLRGVTARRNWGWLVLSWAGRGSR
jgi:hypothetical protein